MTVEGKRLLLDGGEISTSSASAGGGEIRLLVEDVIDLRSSAVTTSVGRRRRPDRRQHFDRSEVSDHRRQYRLRPTRARAEAATSSIVADTILVAEGDLEGLFARGEISASGETEAVSGTVAINAPEVDISGGLVVLDAALLDATSQLRQRCSARRDIGASSFTGVGRGGLPPSPDGPLLSGYAPQRKLAAVESGERREAESGAGRRYACAALPRAGLSRGRSAAGAAPARRRDWRRSRVLRRARLLDGRRYRAASGGLEKRGPLQHDDLNSRTTAKMPPVGSSLSARARRGPVCCNREAVQ